MIITNSQNILIPEYLNEEFFTNALEDGFRVIKTSIHEVNFEWGSNVGDNYCSRIYRVLVTYEMFGEAPRNALEQISLIIKTIPITQETQFLEDAGVFIKEKITYLDVLPRLEILGSGAKFGAKCLYAMKAPVQTIVFNDLRVDGFRLASRQDGLDWHHCELILKSLAEFQATSMVLAQKDPAIVRHYEKGMLSPDSVLKSDTFEHMFGGSLKHLINVVSTWSGYEKITQNLRHYDANFKQITSQLAAAKPGDRFITLNHGDLWTNNFMFAYDDENAPEKPTKAIFVDFQLCFYGSPACDLNFFLNTSVQLDILKNRRDDLIAVYYKHFSDTLQFLRHDSIPTLDDLKYELRSRELYGLFALFGFLPIVTMPKDLSADNSIETMVDEELKNEKFRKVFAIDKLQTYFKYALKRLEDLGVLEDIPSF